MNIENVTYAGPDQKSLIVEADGQLLHVPVKKGNRHYDLIVDLDLPVGPCLAGLFDRKTKAIMTQMALSTGPAVHRASGVGEAELPDNGKPV